MIAEPDLSHNLDTTKSICHQYDTVVSITRGKAQACNLSLLGLTIGKWKSTKFPRYFGLNGFADLKVTWWIASGSGTVFVIQLGKLQMFISNHESKFFNTTTTTHGIFSCKSEQVSSQPQNAEGHCTVSLCHHDWFAICSLHFKISQSLADCNLRVMARSASRLQAGNLWHPSGWSLCTQGGEEPESEWHNLSCVLSGLLVLIYWGCSIEVLWPFSWLLLSLLSLY
jgi:hypothetical protein